MSYEIERRFLIARPDLLNLANLCRIQKIDQTYLVSAEGSLRIRRTEEKGQVTFVETAKRTINALKRQELELKLEEEEYNRRMANRDPRRQTIRKTRYCLPYGDHIFEIDIFPFWTDRAFCEVELSHEDTPVTLPEWLNVVREVTDDKRYTNLALAREIPMEEL